MKVIQPNYRVQFTAEDVDFVVSILVGKTGAAACVVSLLADAETRDFILDDEALHRALLEHQGCLRVCSHFYFYILVRQVLRRAGIEERVVAEMLTEFFRVENFECRVPGQAEPLNYFFEMLAALQMADEHTGFFIRAHIGNHSFFFTGLFPERIRARAKRRGFPDLSYFEELGRANFSVARDHRLADRYGLAPVFDTLAERFQTTRRAFNNLSERLFSWEEGGYALEILGANKLAD